MANTSNMTMTTKIGNFTFRKDVPLSHAKLLRDSVLGQFLNPQGGGRITCEAEAQDFAYEHLGRDLSCIPFNLELNEEYLPKVKPSAGLIEMLEFEADLDRHYADLASV